MKQWFAANTACDHIEPMPVVTENRTGYPCIPLHVALQERDSAELCCPACHRSFPVINSIPILTLRPREMLMVHLQEFKQSQEALEKKHEPEHKGSSIWSRGHSFAQRCCASDSKSMSC